MPGNQTFNNSGNEKVDSTISLVFEVRLLNEVRKAKSLYCSNDPDYSNMSKNRLKWLMIAEKCKKTVSECVRKWHSLLRVYFSSSPEISWIHMAEFKKFEPFLSNHKMHTPSDAQKSQLVEELWCNHYDLQKPEATNEEREKIWLNIVSKCNAITPGVIMSNKNWQKFWLCVKSNFGNKLYTVRSSNYEKNSEVSEKFTEEERKLIEICLATPWDSLANIIKALGKNTELAINKESILLKCKRCLQPREEILFEGFCSYCCQKPKFCSLCEIGGASIYYKLTHWSEQALDLLPIELASSGSICVCNKCSINLNCEATLKWKICRVCESNDQSNLEFLYTNNYNLRRGFKETTKMEFNEDDGLPGYICMSCKYKINKINEFIMKFKSTQNRLMKIHCANFIGNLTKPLSTINSKSPNSTEENNSPRVMLPDNISSDINTATETDSSEVKIVDIKSSATLKEDGIHIPMVNKNALTSELLKIINTQKLVNKKPGVVSISVSRPDKVISGKLMITPKTGIKPLKLIPKTIQSPTQIVFKKINQSNPPKVIANTSISTVPPETPIKPQDQIPMLKKSPSQLTYNLKPTTASKPAIFNIHEETPPTLSTSEGPDYETIEDAPPAFCIPTNRNLNKPTEKTFETKISKNPKLNEEQIIKIGTKPNDSTDPLVSIEPFCTSTNIQSTPNPKVNTRIVRTKDGLVTLKSHPYYSGSVVPVCKQMEAQKTPQKISGFPHLKVQTLSKNRTANYPTAIHIGKGIQIPKKLDVKTNIVIPGVNEQQGLVKKPRKYWGTVDEFQVAPLMSRSQLTTANHISTICSLDVEGTKIINSSDGKKEESSTSNRKPKIPLSFKSKNLRIKLKRDKRLRAMVLNSLIMESFDEDSGNDQTDLSQLPYYENLFCSEVI